MSIINNLCGCNVLGQTYNSETNTCECSINQNYDEITKSCICNTNFEKINGTG